MPNRLVSGNQWRTWLVPFAVAALLTPVCFNAATAAPKRGVADSNRPQVAEALVEPDVALVPRLVAFSNPIEQWHRVAAEIVRAAPAGSACRKAEPNRPFVNKPAGDRPGGEAIGELGLGQFLEQRHCLALEALRCLAVAFDYAPAIRDLLDFSENPNVLMLTPEEEYFYLARALHQGLADPELKARHTRRREALPAKTRADLDAAVRRPERAASLLPRLDCSIVDSGSLLFWTGRPPWP